MTNFIDKLLVVVCSIAILLQLLRIIKLIFQPAFLKHPVFDFPNDTVRRVMLLLCSILIWVMLIALKLGWL